jgi:hypothetical protein
VCMSLIHSRSLHSAQRAHVVRSVQDYVQQIVQAAILVSLCGLLLCTSSHSADLKKATSHLGLTEHHITLRNQSSTWCYDVSIRRASSWSVRCRD